MSVCVHKYEWEREYVCVYMFIQAYIHVETRGQYQALSSSSSLYFGTRNEARTLNILDL